MEHKLYVALRTPPQFDRFSTLYKSDGPVVVFPHGEVAVFDGSPNPDARKMYLNGRIELAATTDTTYSFQAPDKSPVKPAWLTQGGAQYLLIDHEANKAVALGARWLRNRDPIVEPFWRTAPEYYHSASAALTAGGLAGGISVVISRPVTAALRTQVNTFVDEVRTLCSVRAKLKGSNYYHAKGHHVTLAEVRAGRDVYVAGLSDQLIHKIAERGLVPPRDSEKVEFLWVVK